MTCHAPAHGDVYFFFFYLFVCLSRALGRTPFEKSGFFSLTIAALPISFLSKPEEHRREVVR
jgi:hypothetical protein